MLTRVRLTRFKRFDDEVFDLTGRTVMLKELPAWTVVGPVTSRATTGPGLTIRGEVVNVLPPTVAAALSVPAVWAFAQDTGGKQVGAVLGWANMWGNLGAGIAPMMLGGIADRLGWDAALYAGACAFVVSGSFGLMVRADIPLFDEPHTKPALDDAELV